jgi:hypothetical protein
VRRLTFAAWIVAIAVVVAAQSGLHLVAVFGEGRLGSAFDLDRSNGVPDLVSTVVLALATVGAALLVGRGSSGVERLLPWLAAPGLALLTLADVVHDGAHPAEAIGRIVIGVSVVTLVLLGFATEGRPRLTLAVAACLLVGAFLTDGVDRVTQRFEPQRGDWPTESQIVVKEGLELLGWSLVALALWDEAIRRRRRAHEIVPTARASRVPAPSRRRAA